MGTVSEVTDAAYALSKLAPNSGSLGEMSTKLRDRNWVVRSMTGVPLPPRRFERLTAAEESALPLKRRNDR